MPRKRPTPEDTVAARRMLLDGLTRDADIFDLADELAPLHPRNNTFPGEVFLHLAADARLVRRQPHRPAVPGADPGPLPAGVHVPRPAKQEVPVRRAGRGSPSWRD